MKLYLCSNKEYKTGKKRTEVDEEVRSRKDQEELNRAIHEKVLVIEFCYDQHQMCMVTAKHCRLFFFFFLEEILLAMTVTKATFFSMKPNKLTTEPDVTDDMCLDIKARGSIYILHHGQQHRKLF